MNRISEDLEKIASQLDISLTMHKNATDRYKAVADLLAKNGINASIYSQGSFRTGTVVRPIKNCKESNYDLDFICEVDKTIHGTCPEKIKNLVGDVLKSSGIYDDKVEEDTTSENTSDATEQSDIGTSETTGDEIITDTSDTEETEKSEETVPDTKETGKAEPVLDNTGSSEDVTEEKASVPTVVWVIGSCALVGAGAFFGFNLYKKKMTVKS